MTSRCRKCCHDVISMLPPTTRLNNAIIKACDPPDSNYRRRVKPAAFVSKGQFSLRVMGAGKDCNTEVHSHRQSLNTILIQPQVARGVRRHSPCTFDPPTAHHGACPTPVIILRAPAPLPTRQPVVRRWPTYIGPRTSVVLQPRLDLQEWPWDQVAGQSGRSAYGRTYLGTSVPAVTIILYLTHP
jgi:hypothetical protein